MEPTFFQNAASARLRFLALHRVTQHRGALLNVQLDYFRTVAKASTVSELHLLIDWFVRSGHWFL